jgi:hypothetical protein
LHIFRAGVSDLQLAVVFKLELDKLRIYWAFENLYFYTIIVLSRHFSNGSWVMEIMVGYRPFVDKLTWRTGLNRAGMPLLRAIQLIHGDESFGQVVVTATTHC